MSIQDLIRHQKPLTVSLISFLSMLVIVVIIGLAGGNHIVQYLQAQLMNHGLGHNEEVLDGVAPLLLKGLQDSRPRDRIVADFQSFAEHAQPFGVRLFLIDRRSEQVMADSEAPEQVPFSVEDLLGTPARKPDGTPIADLSRWQGPAWRVTPNGAIELISLRHVDSGGAQWMLGVSSDLSELLSFMDALHLHLDTVLLITYGLIGLLGFGVLRWVGRRYESSLEEQVIQRTDELEAVHQKLLEQARLATIGQTASVLAHEMRNPLASMKLALSGIRRSENLSERERQRLELVLGEVDRLEALLSDTLEYVRPVQKDEEPIFLDHLLDQVLELEHPLLAEQGIEIRRQRCESCPPLRLDSCKMQQALLNLVRNAREATPPGGRMEVSLQQQEEMLRLRIHNQGEPLPPDVVAHAFDFFFTTKARGTGLGLGLVKRVVEEHGGRVELRNEGEGVTVEIRLPAGEAADSSGRS